MTDENQCMDKKSLRYVTGQTANFKQLAKDCVGFANAAGGHILIGIEDNDNQPPNNQTIPAKLVVNTVKRVREMAHNVTLDISVKTASNGAEYIELHVMRSEGIASTTDGHFYIRVADQCQPVIGDDIIRLVHDKSVRPWETQQAHKILVGDIPVESIIQFSAMIRRSERIKRSVAEKSDIEVLEHYNLVYNNHLTNLGIMWIGNREHRASLIYAPIVQCVKYDDFGNKVLKLTWDSYEMNPAELIEAIWRDIPDFKEHYEIPDGMFQQMIPAYDEGVVRELLVNALVHRPYTQQGDIFITLLPDRLTITNPGRLPIGVTPTNILHMSVRRNEHLARLFHDIGLMEREGSGFDKIYEIMLSQGRCAPVVHEGSDSVDVTVQRYIAKPESISIVRQLGASYQITQRERIVVGLLALYDGLTARELSKHLEFQDRDDRIQHWLGQLESLKIVVKAGRTKATRYYINPDILADRSVLSTTLTRIEPHRLKALIKEDLLRYPGSKFGEIRNRIGRDIPVSRMKRVIKELVVTADVKLSGATNGARYSLNERDK
ncbi:MAG: ATP-binding protein [Armatimonadota bacterium]